MAEVLRRRRVVVGEEVAGGGPCTALALLLGLLALGCGDSGERAAGEMLGALERGKITGTKGTMETIAQGLRAYSVDRSGYPETESIEDLMASLVPAHLRAPAVNDAWGHPFSYSGGRLSFRLTSDGPDGRTGTADDIVMIDGRFEPSPPTGG